MGQIELRCHGRRMCALGVDDEDAQYTSSYEAGDMSISLSVDGEKQRQQRVSLLEELVASEKSYLKDLNDCIRFFEMPLRVLARHSKQMKKVDDSVITMLFQNIDRIAELHQRIVYDMEFAVERNYSVCAVIVKHAKLLNLEYVSYISGFDASSEKLSELTKSDRQFRSFVETQKQDEPNVRVDLSSYLIMPVQRVPRYCLLLRDLILNSPDDDRSVSLVGKDFAVRALEAVEGVADNANETQQHALSVRKLNELGDIFPAKKYKEVADLLEKFRVLHLEGIVSVNMGQVFAETRCVLFADGIFMYNLPNSFKGWLLITPSTEIHDVSQPERQSAAHSLHITGKNFLNEDEPMSVEMRFENRQTLMNWQTNLESCLEAIKT